MDDNPVTKRKSRSSGQMPQTIEIVPLIYALTSEENPTVLDEIKNAYFDGLISNVKLEWLKQTFELLQARVNTRKSPSLMHIPE